MKKAIFGFIILTALIIFTGVNSIYQSKVIDKMLTTFDLMSEAPSLSNAEIADELVATWDKNAKFFSLSTHVHEVDKLTVSLTKLAEAAHLDDLTQYRLILDEVYTTLIAFEESVSFSINNIL